MFFLERYSFEPAISIFIVGHKKTVAKEIGLAGEGGMRTNSHATQGWNFKSVASLVSSLSTRFSSVVSSGLVTPNGELPTIL